VEAGSLKTNFRRQVGRCATGRPSQLMNTQRYLPSSAQRMGYLMGAAAGTENTTLLYNNMPLHTHLVQCNTGGGNQASPANGFPAVESTGTSQNYNSAAGSTMSSTMIENAGGNVPFNNIQPYLCISFCIAMTGIFPSRN
jgi:microcystin-dependent protein